MLSFSKSKLNTFIACPERYRLVYELNLRPSRDKPLLVEGRALHELVEQGLVLGTSDINVLEIISNAFWEQNPFERCFYDSLDDYRNAQTTCLIQAVEFLRLIGPLDIDSVELHLISPIIDPITLENRRDMDLHGYIDLVDSFEGDQRIIDLKTVSRTPSETNAAMALELTCYAYLKRHPEVYSRFDPINVAFLYLIRTKKPKILWQNSIRTIPHFQELTDTCIGIAEVIQAGHFWKNPGMSCSWCDFLNFCLNRIDLIIEEFGEDAVDAYYNSLPGSH